MIVSLRKTSTQKQQYTTKKQFKGHKNDEK